ncbi:MAG: endolytic transglycosylase MltG [Proteobacteria bacterium]|nr:endolytic transglycosylase MltG [Pseudomonadota bacterium]
MGRRLNTHGSLKSTLAVITLMGGLACLGLLLFLLKGSPGSETKDVLIPRGLSLKAVSELLAKEGVVQHPVVFQNLLRFTRGNKKVRAGEFRFRVGANLLNALRVLYQSEPITHSITVPEGWNVRQIAALVQEKGLGKSERFVQLALSPNTPKKYQLLTPHLEGFLYPDTYLFSRVDGEEKILETMVNRFFQEYNSRFKSRIPASGMTLEKVVTLASIVEKETGKPEERPKIASVFFNRLKKGMRLQSDPTTIYGIENFNGNITKADLQRWTPYNTYTIPGLPPGPIASPGGDAIEAVLKPDSSEFLYFVSDNNGSHFFTKTYKDHLRLVRDYQIRRKK